MFSLQFSQFQKFFLILAGRKFLALNFFFVLLVLVFVPNQSYYQTVQASWRPSSISRSHFVVPAPALFPQKTGLESAPELTAKGIIVIDPLSSVRLYEKNAASPLYPASTTKIMTSLVAMDNFKMDDILIVPKLIDEGQDIKLVEGEKLTAESLLYALLVASANDAAETLAANFPGGREAFIAKMNEKAGKLYLKETRFVNPSGIDQEGGYVSPFDLALLTKRALQNPRFAQMVATERMIITDTEGLRVHEFSNINQLLGKVEGVRGVKTGFTESAGECLVTYVERDGKKLIIVVLGSEDRFGETKKLIDWVYSNFIWGQALRVL